MNRNGFFSFGRRVAASSSENFPDRTNSTHNIVAPFWANQDTHTEGQVSYEVHNPSTSNQLLLQVSLFITQIMNNDFLWTWMIIGEWKDLVLGSTAKVTSCQSLYFILLLFLFSSSSD